MVPTRKRQDETSYVQIEIEKGKEEKIKISKRQQRKKEETRQHARGIRIHQARRVVGNQLKQK